MLYLKNFLSNKYQNQFDNIWALENPNDIASREAVKHLISKLNYTKELDNSENNFQHKEPYCHRIANDLTPECLTKYVQEVILDQYSFGRSICATTLSSEETRNKILILLRIYNSIKNFYHTPNPTCPEPYINLQVAGPSLETETEHLENPHPIIKFGITTLISLIFNSLKRNLITEDSSESTSNICIDVLETACDFINGLPPLSFCNDTQITSLGVEGLSEAGDFLRYVILGCPQSSKLKDKALELHINLSLQRGKLSFLIDWIDIALVTTYISDSIPKLNLNLFNKTMALLQTDENMNTSIDSSITVNKAAMLFLREIVTLNTNLIYSWLNFKYYNNEYPVYVCGSNTSNQISSDNEDNLLLPRLSTSFSKVQYVEAAQYCSFVIHTDGTLTACGRGNYGQLGLGDIVYQALPKEVIIDTPVKFVSSSKGSNGHCLAVTEDGRVYSWGDGDFGKLGHGHVNTIKYPKLITGPFIRKQIIHISAGYRHSAAVTKDGELYTWGDGEDGRLGHGDCISKYIPTQVSEIGLVSQVACGGAHTIALSKDYKTIWSFGSGDHGQLGHGDDQIQITPQIVTTLNGIIMAKIVAASQFSMALTITGEVYSWGLSYSSNEISTLQPQKILDFLNFKIIDIAVGDSHALALTSDHEIYSWGNNSSSQLGRGHCSSLIIKPHKVVGLENIPIMQISAGTSHSIFTSVPPPNHQIIAIHRPFSLQIDPHIFEKLHKFLKIFTISIHSNDYLKIFDSRQEQETFVLHTLELIKLHLAFAKNTQIDGKLSEKEIQQLRPTLFELIELTLPRRIMEELIETINVGITLLIPSLKERIDMLSKFIIKVDDLSNGEKILLNILLKSVHYHDQITDILGLGSCPNLVDSTITLNLLKVILDELTSKTFSHFNETEEDNYFQHFPHGKKITQLLSIFFDHLLADCIGNLNEKKLEYLLKIILKLYLMSCCSVYEKAIFLLDNEPSKYKLIIGKRKNVLNLSHYRDLFIFK